MAPAHRQLWIIGTGGHARVVLDLARACGHAVAGFIDPAPNPGPTADATLADEPEHLHHLPLIRGLHAIAAPPAPAFAVAIGDNRRRRETATEALRLGARLTTLVHPRALIEPSATIGAGAQICLGAIIAAAADIGPDAIINSGAIIEHECRIGPAAHVAPGAALAGRVVVGEGAFVGLGARVIQGVTIGAHAIIGAGAVVLDDVDEGATVVGVPARPIER